MLGHYRACGVILLSARHGEGNASGFLYQRVERPPTTLETNLRDERDSDKGRIREDRRHAGVAERVEMHSLRRRSPPLPVVKRCGIVRAAPKAMHRVFPVRAAPSASIGSGQKTVAHARCATSIGLVGKEEQR